MVKLIIFIFTKIYEKDVPNLCSFHYNIYFNDLSGEGYEI